MRIRRRILPRADINVTPFIDILLVLLVIFMTITPTVPSGLSANVPQLPPPGQLDRNPDKVLILSMDAAGVLKLNQEEVEPSHLGERLQNIFKTRSDRTMFVQAADRLLFSDVARLIDTARGAGADRLGLMTAQIGMK